jgi:uncharacterized protein (DUF2141 family)
MISSVRAVSAGAALLLVATAPPASAQTPSLPSGTLSVAADGFKSGAGHAFARLYRPGDNIVGAPWRLVRADIHDGRAVFDFKDLAFGAYALVVHHDVNDNGTIDHNAIGFPAEPLGFSNGFKLGLFSGKPTFDKLRFSFAPTSTSTSVTVR